MLTLKGEVAICKVAEIAATARLLRDDPLEQEEKIKRGREMFRHLVMAVKEGETLQELETVFATRFVEICAEEPEMVREIFSKLLYGAATLARHLQQKRDSR